MPALPRRLLPIALLVGGCSAPLDLPESASALDASTHDLATEAAVTPLAACVQPFTTLVAVSEVETGHSITLTSQTFTSEPSSYCLHLDLTNAWTPYFSASTTFVSGETSGMKLSLFDLHGTLLAEGSDLTIGDKQDTTAAELSVSWPSHEIDEIDVVVHAVSADGVAHTTDLTLTAGQALD